MTRGVPFIFKNRSRRREKVAPAVPDQRFVGSLKVYAFHLSASV